MCQLNFCYSNNKDFMKKYVLLQNTINSDGRHDDGFGMFYNSSTVIKTKIPAKNISNLGKLVSPIEGNKIISHTRDASFGVPVEDKYSHPFESAHFVLAHNGALKEKLPKLDIKESLSDSETFLFALEFNYKKAKVKDFVKIINKTMESFTGSFAFLIYDKVHDKFYAVRGKGKPLHYTKVKIKKSSVYLINTEKANFDQCLILLTNLYAIDDVKLDVIRDEKEFISFTTPEDKIGLLEEEKIYLLEDDITVVGEIKENETPVYSVVHAPNRNNQFGSGYGNISNSIPTEEEFSPSIKIIEELMIDYGLNLKDIDILLDKFFGVTKLTCDEKRIVELKEKLGIIKIVNDDTLAKVAEYCYWNGGISIADYNDFNIQYPYFINTDKEILEFLELLQSPLIKIKK